MLILIAPVPAVVSCGYLWWVYAQDVRRPRSWLIRMLAVTSSGVTLAAVYFGVLAAARLSGFTLPAWVIYLSAGIVLLLDAIPVYKAVRIYAARHDGREPASIPS